MRILFDNYILTASLSATNQDTSYPVSNIVHRFLTKYFKSTGTTSTITAVLPVAKSIDSIYVSFTNATAITYSLYNAADSVIGSGPLDSYGAANFASVANVKKITVSLSSPSTLYVGTIQAGETYIDYPISDILKKPIDTTYRTESAYGQTLANKTPMRKAYDVKLSMGIDDYDTIFLKLAENEMPVMFDLYPLTRQYATPIYSVVTIGDVSRSEHNYNVTLNIREAR